MVCLLAGTPDYILSTTKRSNSARGTYNKRDSYVNSSSTTKKVILYLESLSSFLIQKKNTVKNNVSGVVSVIKTKQIASVKDFQYLLHTY